MILLLILGGLLLPALALWWLLVRPSASGSARVEVLGTLASPEGGLFIGSYVCRECHPGEYALYTESGHARTLRPAAEHPVAARIDGREVADPEISGVSWRFDLDGDRLTVDRKAGDEVETMIVDFALGSAHHATTFVTLDDAPDAGCLEHRLTYFTAVDSLGITPGQERDIRLPGTTPRGREITPGDTLRCFACHTTRLSRGELWRLDLPNSIAGVACERCHGPARVHVTAARRGETDLRMPMGFDEWTADSQLFLCGECHRHPSRVPPAELRPDNLQLARFQPIGLSQSRCYRESDGALSCVNCHDPHARSSSDRSAYESSCLECHNAAPRTVCPVSPRDGCIGCHMPRVDSGQRVLFTDHWIRVRREEGREGQMRDNK